jgi:hypothetical protein
MSAFDTNNAVAFLTVWSEAFEQHYRPGVADFLKRHGKTTRVIPMRKQRVFGNSIEYTVKAFHNRSTRVTNDATKAMPDPAPGEYVTFTVNFDYETATSNDFAVFEVAFRTSIYDLWKRGDRTFKDASDFIRKDVEEGLDDVKETFAKYLHLPADGLLATIDTTGIRNDDDDRWDSASAYTNDGTSDTAKIRLATPAIARLGDGQRIEIRNRTGGDTPIVNSVRVTYVHPYYNTIDVQVTTDSTDGEEPGLGGAITTLDEVDDALDAGDTVDIYLNGSFDQAPSGTLAQLFDSTTAYYGAVRDPDDTSGTYDARNRILIPIRIDLSGGGADVSLTADNYRRVGEAVGWQQGGFQEAGQLVQIMSRYEYRQVSAFVEDEGIKMVPALESEVGRGLNKAFGFDGFILHDPNLGTQMLVVDDFAEPGQIDFLNRSQWEQATPIDGGFRMFPGEVAGIWSRNTESDGSGRPSKFYSANGLQLAAFVCRWPKGQIRMQGIATPAVS